MSNAPSDPPATKSRKRAANWSKLEERRLAELYEEHESTFSSKSMHPVAIRAKRDAWDLITKELNNMHPEANRDVESVKNKWKNLVRDTKVQLSADRKETKKTGGGPKPDSKVTDISDKVMVLNTDTEKFQGITGGLEVGGPDAPKVEDQGANLADTEPATDLTAETAEPGNQTAVETPKGSRKRAQAGFLVVKPEPSPSTAELRSECLMLEREKLTLEMEVLRSQRNVLESQGEYYSLKIMKMKSEMGLNVSVVTNEHGETFTNM